MDEMNGLEPEPTAGRVVLAELRQIGRKLLACNPFYLISAAFLLYGLGHAVNATLDHHNELENLLVEPMEFLMHYATPEVYGLLLVGTAVFLCRRKVWYDSTLLVVLAMVFLPVSAILLNLGLKYRVSPWFIGSACVLTVLLAVVKAAALKYFFRDLNLPPGLLAVGVVFLLANLIAPLVFSPIHKHGAVSQEGIALFKLMLVTAKTMLLPGLALLSLLLPRARSWPDFAPRRSSLPLLISTAWVAVTGFHLFWIGFVYDFAADYPDATQFLPVLWAMGWVVVWRLTDLWRAPSLRLRARLRLLPAILGLLTFGFAYRVTDTDNPMLMVARVILVINLGLSFWYSFREGLRLPRVTTWVTVFALLSSVQITWTTVAGSGGTDYNRYLSAGAAVLVLLLLAGWLRRRPVLGVFGAMGLLAGLLFLLRHTTHGFDISWQCAYWYLLLHSCFWGDKPHWGAVWLRRLTALVLLVHAWIWVFDDSVRGAWTTTGLAAAMLAIWAVCRFVLHRQWPRLVAITAVAAVTLVPIHWMYLNVREGVGGFVMIILALLFFGAGTLLALSRQHLTDLSPAEESPAA